MTAPLDHIVVEVAVDSLAAAEVAVAAGADRLELCQAQELGGLTPSPGLIAAVRARVRLPVFIMIRPRAGEFVFSPAEIEVMAQDVRAAADGGADGIVVAALSADGSVNLDAMRRLVRSAGELPVTFHRAFDHGSQPIKALDHLAELRVARVLTAGGAVTALAGAAAIARYVKRAPSGLTVIAGGGITGEHVVELIRRTGVTEVHLSGTYQMPCSVPDGFGLNTLPNPARLLRLVSALRADREMESGKGEAGSGKTAKVDRPSVTPDPGA